VNLYNCEFEVERYGNMEGNRKQETGNDGK